MSTIHLHQTTTSTPEQFVAGLTDFGPGRSKLFGNSADDYLKVHQQGALDWQCPPRVPRPAADRRPPAARARPRRICPPLPDGGLTAPSTSNLTTRPLAQFKRSR